MNIDIQSRNFRLTDALDSHIRRRLNDTLTHRLDQIQQIRVRLSDVNGPRGGADKRCHLQIVMPQLQDVVVDDTGLDMYAAISRAVQRAARAVSRRLSRQRVRSQKPLREPQADPDQPDYPSQEDRL